MSDELRIVIAVLSVLVSVASILLSRQSLKMARQMNEEINRRKSANKNERHCPRCGRTWPTLRWYPETGYECDCGWRGEVQEP